MSGWCMCPAVPSRVTFVLGPDDLEHVVLAGPAQMVATVAAIACNDSEQPRQEDF